MADIDFTAPVWFLTCVVVIFLMVTLRYFLVAGIFFVVFLCLAAGEVDA